MSLQALSPVSQYHVRVALSEVFKGYVHMTSNTSARYFPAEKRDVLLKSYGRDAFDVLHDLGGMASPW